MIKNPRCDLTWEELIEEEVNNNPCDRNVEPDWERIARDASMLGESRSQGPDEGYRHNDRQEKGQEGVGEKDCEVDGSDCSDSLKAYTANFKMVDEV